jgi:exosortase
MSADTLEAKPLQRQWMIFWLVLLFANVPMVIVYLAGLWAQPHYQFFPFAFLAVGVLFFQRWDRVWMPPRGWITCLGLGLSLALSLLGSFLFSPYLSMIGFAGIVLILLLSHNEGTNRSLAVVAILVGLLVRVPLGYDQLLINRLQITTTALSSVLLDFLRVPHATGNNTIQLASRELFVAEACSGIQSVFTLIFLAALLIVIYRRPIWFAPIYCIVGIVLAVFANVIRVTTVALGDVWIGVDLASGWQHEAVGYIALAIGILFLLSFDHLILSVLHPVDDGGGGNPLVDLWNHFFEMNSGSIFFDLLNRGPQWLLSFVRSSPIRISFLVLASAIGVHGAVKAAQFQISKPVVADNSGGIIIEVNEKLLDIPLKNLQLTSHEKTRDAKDSRLGENADVWSGSMATHPEVEVQVVLSQPYPEWHELCLCYSMIDWNILNREALNETDAVTQDPDFALARLKKGPTSAYLIYGAIDSNGDLVTPPPMLGRLGSRFGDYFPSDASRKQSGPVLMLQVFAILPGDFDRELLDDLMSDFSKIRSVVNRELVSKANGNQTGVVSSEDKAANEIIGVKP